MIVFLDGIIDTIENDSLYINVQGVGYQVYVPASVLSQLGEGANKRIYTYQQVREESVRLFGFLSIEELELFKMLIGVNGVGPKAGIGILGAYTVDNIISAIQRGDERLFASVPGIGKKGAAKIVIDLKGKVGDFRVTDNGGREKLLDTPETDDLIDSLVSLGYSEREVYGHLNKIDKEQSLQNQIKQMLEMLRK